MANVTDNMKKSVQDAAYLAVGVGVLGAHQAQSRAEATQAKLEARAKEARDRLESLAGSVRDRVEPVVVKVEQRVEPILGEIEARIEPVIGQVRAKAKEIAATGTVRANAWLARNDRTVAQYA